ncbi:MAG: hypothetical protein HS101_01710 [Planctomycetia bacterium]|nr:hypothetical protein [Planctomycetia bacterium]MCC7314094.1 hypothetical protein [Planctomycetota bacterium]OQZ06922.1 MAG: hypothetical protein B6D36_02625 [Planctomycetes bacterium UTPLA1]
MTRKLSFCCAAILACVCFGQVPLQAENAHRERPDSVGTPTADGAYQPALPDGALRRDRSYVPQARPNSNYNTRPVFPMIPPPELQNRLDGAPRGEPPPCTLEPCEILIYDNLNGPNAAANINDPAETPTYDDCALVGIDRFICRFSFVLGDLNNTGGLIPYTLIVRSGNYFPICPEDSRSVVLYTATQNVPATNPFNIVNFDISPPLFLDEDFFWIGMMVPAADAGAGWGIGGPAELGFTEDNMVIPNNNGTCEDLGPGQMDDYFWFGGDPYAGLQVQVFANPGDPGACCDRDMNDGMGNGTCTDSVFRSVCLVSSTTSVWKPGTCSDFGMTDPACALCISQADACVGATVDAEPNCSAGYVDNYNENCLIPNLPTIACGQSICATAGTYNSACTADADCSAGQTCVTMICTGPADSRDNDWYKLVLTQDTQVTIDLNARFSAQMSLINNGGDPMTCTDDALDFEAGRACEVLSIVRCLPAGTWFIRVRPDTFAGIPCDTRYRLSVSCGSCSLPTGACCDASPAGCSELAEVACVGRAGQYQGDGTLCAGAGCPGVPSNDDCGTKIQLAGVMVEVTPDTSFASDSTNPPQDPADCDNEPLSTGNILIRKDVFYNYRIPTNFNGTPVTAGDVVLSTAGSAIDAWIIVYGQPNAVNNCGVGLCGAPQYACSDQILDNGTNFKFNSVGHLVIPVEAGSASFFDPGDCIKIRIGRGRSPVTPAAPAGGQARLGIDFIPRSSPFTLQTGRCCFADGSCQITIDEPTCLGLNGFPRPSTDFNQGDPSVGDPVAGCKADPCPGVGDACFRAIDLNVAMGSEFGQGVGSGALTRNILDIMYLKYEVPAVGGVVIHSCGSNGFYDSIIGVYGSVLSSGDCDLGSLIKYGDDCTSTESTANGALTVAPCYGGINATSNACLCLSVGPGMDVTAGQIIYIAVGSSNIPGKQFVFAGSPRLIVDPVTDPIDTPVVAAVTVETLNQCFTCPATCPMGAIDEGNDQICQDTNDPNPQDTWNGGCNSATFDFNSPTIDCSGGPVTICGRSGNFRHPFPCDNPLDCPGNEPCTGVGGSCIGNNLFVNRDEDWFKLVVTEPRTIFWRVLSEEFAGQLDIFADPEGDCDSVFVLASNSVSFACEPPAGTPSPLEISASVCAGTYYLRVTQSVFGGLGTTECSAEYVVQAECSGFDQPADCCLGDMNADGKVNGLDIQKWVSVLFTPPTVFDEFLGCFSANYCRADIDSSGAIDMGDLSGFVSLLVTANKPVCTLNDVCTDAATSQFPFDSMGASESDLEITPPPGTPSPDKRAADCFRPLESGQITQVCWWGGYADLAGADCGPEPDCFQITFYSGSVNRCPGTRIEPPGSQYVGNATRATTGGAIITPAGLLTEYFYSATLATPLTVTAGNTYWIEITNNTPESLCKWVWEQSPQGDTRHAIGDGADDLPTDYSACTAANIGIRDLAFSINLRIAKDGCGKPTGRCCHDPLPLGGVVCSITTEGDCVAVLNGEWSEDGTCSPENPACTLGRCCYLDMAMMTQCASTTQSACNAANGLWVEGASCPCPTGRCCIDTTCTSGVSEVACSAQGGIWLQGADCSSPCPTGICENIGRCQLPHLLGNNLQQGGYVSDADNGISTADDIRPLFTSGANFINQICFRGFHRQGANADCGGGVETPETFRITYYAASGDLPNTATIIGGPFDLTPLKSVAITAGNPEGVQGGGVQYQYEAFHAAVNVTPSACIWVEIQNTVVDLPCVFFWATSAEGGNQKAAVRSTGATAFPYQIVDRDLSYCVGPVNVSSAVCAFSPVAPANDQCANATNIGTGPAGPIVGTTIGATTDPGSSSGCGPAANTRDVYYRWTQVTPAAATTFQICTLDSTFDAIISVHKTTSGVMGCPATSADDSQIAVNGGCNDDGCPQGLGTNTLFFQGRQARLVRNASQAASQLPSGQTFLIRISGAVKSGTATNPPDGKFVLQVTQP